MNNGDRVIFLNVKLNHLPKIVCMSGPLGRNVHLATMLLFKKPGQGKLLSLNNQHMMVSNVLLILILLKNATFLFVMDQITLKMKLQILVVIAVLKERQNAMHAQKE